METIDITSLNNIEKQGLVCLFYAKLPKSDSRIRNCFKDWQVLEKRFNRKISSYRKDQEAFYRCFDADNREDAIDEKFLDERQYGYQNIYDAYKACDDEALELAVRKILKEFSDEEVKYVSMKCGFPETVHRILAGESQVTVDGIYTLKEELTTGQIVFFTLGGDTGKAEVDWDPGFIGIAHIIKEPYDFGYNGKAKYFKIDILVDCIFDKPFKREDFIPYLDAYDAAYIGPELSRDPSQAISSLDVVKAVAIIRAIIDKYPDLENNLRTVFGEDILDRAKGAVRKLLPVSLNYGESNSEIIASVTEEIEREEKYDNDSISTITIKGGVNILYYGVPGAGKSYAIDQEISSAEYERIVFHPDYTYSDFVGQIMPQLKKDENGIEKLSYGFVPGPFTKALKAAIQNRGNMHYLVIEEINRGNAPAVFGDVFQLLDRNDDGNGKYHITNFDIAREVYGDENAEIRIPSNLSILATMNTSDQNVFTLDTAFQRRWNMKYIENNIAEAEHANEKIEYSDVTWGGFASAVNAEILECNVELSSAEDKQLGAYFVTRAELTSDKFPEKALKYLWDDAFKLEREKIFRPEIKSVGDLVHSYDAEIKNDRDPIKGVMRAEVYRKMMDMSASGPEEAIDESEIFEAEINDGE